MTEANRSTGKVSFDHVYDLPDPRAYVRALAPLDYQIPAHAQAVFSLLARSLRDRRGDGRSSVLDVCCSYGINPLLLNHEFTLDELYARYTDPALGSLSSGELAAADRSFYATRRNDPLPVVGLDLAANAVEYAIRAGMMDAGSTENLETADPSETLKRLLADVGLVTITGGVGYVTATTFDRLLGTIAADEPVWLAAFCLRWVDMAPIGAVLARYGLTLEHLPGHTFRQRRFATEGEREHALAQLRHLGLDPERAEADGYHHSALYVARPTRDVAELPLAELLAPVVGGS